MSVYSDAEMSTNMVITNIIINTDDRKQYLAGDKVINCRG